MNLRRGPNDDVARGIVSLLEAVPEKDRLGFLYGILIGLLRNHGLTRMEIEKHLEYGLAAAFKDETS